MTPDVRAHYKASVIPAPWNWYEKVNRPVLEQNRNPRNAPKHMEILVHDKWSYQITGAKTDNY